MMRNSTRLGGKAAAIVLAAGLATAVFAQAAMTKQTSLDGTLTMVNGQTVAVTTATMGMKIALLASDTLILERQKVAVGDIKEGEALGVAAVKNPDGSLTATVINIFAPELYPRVKKGQFPMDSGQIMTNAVVTKFEADMNGKTLTMQAEGGSYTILVPEAAEVHRMVAVKPAELKVGMHVIIRGEDKGDGKLAATFISADTN